jgi:uncharacterized membrane protein
MKKLILSLEFMFLAFAVFAQTQDSESMVSFPNYHPLVVHFPIILLLAAAVMQIGMLFFKNKAYNYVIIAFTIIGFITGLLASNLFHAHASESIPAAQMAIFESHEKFANITIWLSGVAACVKLLGLFIKMKWVEALALVLLLGSAVAVSIAGHHGAELVYKYGIGPKGDKLEKEN